MRNLADEDVDLHGVFTNGGDAGFVATILATTLPVLIAPLVATDVDIWTFWKGVGTILLGDGAAQPPTGFDAAPVLAGMGIHLFIGTLIGALFAVAIAYFDIDTWTPTIVVAGCILAVSAFTLTWVPLSHSLVPALDDVPVVFTGWMIILFGILLGVGIYRWREQWDRTQCHVAAGTSRSWMLVAHERAIVATSGTLALVVAAIVIAGTDEIRMAIAVPYLLLNIAAATLILVHTASDLRALRGRRGISAATE